MKVKRSKHSPLGIIAEGPYKDIDAGFYRSKFRKDIIKISESLTKFAHDNHIANVIFADISARLAYLGLTHTWRKQYPSEKVPGRYFVSPNLGNPSEQDINLFQQNYTELMKDKDKPLLIFDTCAHTGRTLYYLNALCEASGFKHIFKNLAYSSVEDFEIDEFYLSTYKCLPFGRGVKLTRGRVLSEKFESNSDSFRPRERIKRLEILSILNKDYQIVR